NRAVAVSAIGLAATGLIEMLRAYPASHALAAFVEMLIVDEADRLKTPALEQLPDHYGRSRLGMILIGMPYWKNASPATRSSTAGSGAPTNPTRRSDAR